MCILSTPYKALSFDLLLLCINLCQTPINIYMDENYRSFVILGNLNNALKSPCCIHFVSVQAATQLLLIYIYGVKTVAVVHTKLKC